MTFFFNFLKSDLNQSVVYINKDLVSWKFFNDEKETPSILYYATT